MIKYQVGASIRELFGLRFRTLLLILQVIVVAATLAATLNDTLRSIDDISVAHSLEGRGGATLAGDRLPRPLDGIRVAG